jgi:hypothetical protein
LRATPVASERGKGILPAYLVARAAPPACFLQEEQL